MGRKHLRFVAVWLALFALPLSLFILTLGILLRVLIGPNVENGFSQNSSLKSPQEATQSTYGTEQRQRSLPVDLNQGDQIPKGFRDGTHPVLRNGRALPLVARWTKVGKGLDKLHENVPPPVYRLFLDLKPAEPERTYSAADFSAFLPEEIEDPGQIWALDRDGVLKFLTQFHERPSLELVAAGRRGGPNGAFAILRATGDRHVDIVFRIHAEFDLKPKVWQSPIPLSGVWFTPAFLEGQMIVNRETGTVEYFRLGLPEDRTLNVHLTVAHPRGDNHDIVRVDHMELVGGDAELARQIEWAKEIPAAEAQSTMTQAFYKFAEIEWVPVHEALAAARDRQRPIMAMVMWGALDDQSC
jgi:hypothetical protein